MTVKPQALAIAVWVNALVFQVNALKREELIATDSMLLHEVYFRCLSGAGAEMAPAMALTLSASVGSVARRHQEFVAMVKAVGGGCDWVLLTFNLATDLWSSNGRQTTATPWRAAFQFLPGTCMSMRTAWILAPVRATTRTRLCPACTGTRYTISTSTRYTVPPSPTRPGKTTLLAQYCWMGGASACSSRPRP